MTHPAQRRSHLPLAASVQEVTDDRERLSVNRLGRTQPERQVLDIRPVGG